MIVSYCRQDDGTVKRQIVRGPSLYMPAPNEWVHHFNWGTQGDTPAAKPLPKAQAPPQLQQQQQQVQPQPQQQLPSATSTSFYRLSTTPDTVRLRLICLLLFQTIFC